MEAGTQGKRISEATAALSAAALDCLFLPCPVELRQEPSETGPIPEPLSADLVVHSPETATGSARQNKLKRWRKPGWQAPLSPIQAHAEQGMMGLGARVCLDIRVPDQKPRGSEPTTQMQVRPPSGAQAQWGAGVPDLLPRAPKLDILEVNGLNKVDFPRLAALLIKTGRHRSLAPHPQSHQCPCHLHLPTHECFTWLFYGSHLAAHPLYMGLYSCYTPRPAH